VLAAFLKTVEEQIALIPAAMAEGEWEVVRQEAHSLKGGAWNLAAEPIGNAAGKLEEAAKAEDGETSRSAFAVLQEEFERLRSAAAPYVS
jgi:HPt (histidine-containing phosphotransfer) domain-containing protein